MRIFEVNPHNYDSDIDYYDALKRQGRKPNADDYDPEEEAEKRRLNRPQSQAEIEDEISQSRQKAHQKFLEKRKTEMFDKEGEAPNGKRYNRIYQIDAVDEPTAQAEVRGFNEYHWGAKHIVDVRRLKAHDSEYPVRFKVYIVDNHKYGMWKPFPGVEGQGGGRPIPDTQDE